MRDDEPVAPSVHGALADDLTAVARFGGAETGVTRLAWSDELRAAYDWLTGELTGLGLEVEVDAAGNLIGRWAAGAGPAVLVGSHLDSVPAAGRYDGTLGVLAGLQAIRHLKSWDVTPRRPLWLASWMDEEGQRFGTALMGSRAFVGDDVSGLGGRRDAGGRSLAEAMAAWSRSPERTPDARAVDAVGAYLELHIEQGPVLDRAGLDLGLVTGIVALVGYRARYLGQANHAGTTPMELRRDALAGAARAVLALRDEARRTPGMTANVGVIAAEPGATNAVPGACEFTIDVRSPDDAGLAAAESAVDAILRAIAEEEGLGLEVAELYRLPAAPMDAGLLDVLERSARGEGARFIRMPSGAGHDAQMLAPRVPTAMLFVPSRGGVSHSPQEYTAPEHCDLGALVLAGALRELLTAEG
jgi:hydantoinase/carbamoylase family amidase